ncbi:MAG: helix-turn-helix transcriptional regulator, partial [Bacilli bacterium]|nr:helix-turn-helix transcriptional regulator [Bacilli bacterium]
MTGGEKIKKGRNELHLKQRAFAKKLGVTPQTVVNWEKKESLSDREISLICLKFGVREGFFDPEDGGESLSRPASSPSSTSDPVPLRATGRGVRFIRKRHQFHRIFLSS